MCVCVIVVKVDTSTNKQKLLKSIYEFMMQSLLQHVNDIWGIYCIDNRFIYSLEGND